jgi:hypothetical protein
LSSRLKLLLASAALAAITLAYTWPLAADMRSAVAHDRGDPLLVTWILWWSSHAVPLTDAWWNAPAFHPSAGVFAFSENLLSLAPIAVPINWFTHSPLLAYNVTFLLSYFLCGVAAYWLAFVLTRSHSASFVAAIAYAFAPYRLSHTQHLQLLSSYWMPVAVAALHLYVREPRWRWAALFAGAWMLQALASGYYLFFLSAFAAVWLAWFVPGRVRFRDCARLAVAWLVAAALLAPLLLTYRAIHASYGFKRSPVELVNYSADVLGVVSASPYSRFWGWLHAPVSSESEQFPGLVVVLFLLAGAIPRKRGQSPFPTAGKWGLSPFSFYAIGALLMWLLSLGPEPRMAGTAIGVPGPYAVLAMLPGFDGIRVPARFWMLAVMCLATVAALAVARIESVRTRRLVAAVAVAGLLLDAWPRAYPVVSVPGMRVTGSAARVRLGLPFHETQTETMYGAIAEGKQVFNGYSGYAAPQHAALRDLLEHRDPRILPRLAAGEPIEVIVESAGDADGEWNAYVRSQPRARQIHAEPEWTAYEIPATGALPLPPPTGETLRIARISASHNTPDINAVLDGDLDTRWHVRPQAGGETITLELDGTRHVAAIVLSLGTYAGQYPRALEVEVSIDGGTWTTAFSGDTALDAYDAALRSPREVPIAIRIARDGVRYIRLRQTGSEPRTGWTIVELRVIG